MLAWPAGIEKKCRSVREKPGYGPGRSAPFRPKSRTPIAVAISIAAATDNVGLFFGEDIFLAIGSILLMKGLLEGYGYVIEPLHFSVWAIPTAIAAFLIHGVRLRLLEKRMLRAPGQGTGA